MSAILEVQSGPDQGKRFPLDGELLHMGRGTDNHIVLSDPQLGEFHASMSVSGNQFALYANESQEIQVGETRLPRQQWVPISTTEAIQLGGSTTVRILTSDPVVDAAPSSVPVERKKPARRESKRQVARMITNRPVEAVVQLGSDGRYPELALAHVAAPAKSENQPRESNPVLLFTVLAASCLSSVGLLLVDFDSASMSAPESQESARGQLASFYGKDSSSLEPYQKMLRQAAIEYSQGQRQAERTLLTQVLDLLKAVDAKNPENLNGLTGKQTGRGKASDRELRQLLETILAR